MEATHKYFSAFLEGHDKRFVIPVYQRNYDWRREHCEQLIDDLLNVIKEEQDAYFMGSIVSIPSDGHGTEQVIIDGQQRITTISIFLLAMRNLLEKDAITADDKNLSKKIDDHYLKDKYTGDVDRIRLKPVKDDDKAFQKLFKNSSDEFIDDSNITNNYKFFESRIIEIVKDTNHKISVDDLFDAFKKLMIVDIKLDREKDKPQLVFESLNSTGKKLEEGDLIRNFILMNKKPAEQENLYEDYWHPIEKNTQHNVSDFIRDYLTHHNSKPPRKDRVYRAFRKFIQEEQQGSGFQLENFLGRLRQFSEYYGQIRFSDIPEPAVKEAMTRINDVDIGVSYPYLLDLFHAWQSEKRVTDEEMTEALTLIESFAFRRRICEVPTNMLNKIFATLGKNIRQNIKEDDNYLEVLKYHLTQKSGNSRFPQDDEFKKHLIERDIYNLKDKNRRHLFEGLEHFENKERINIKDEEDLSVEHIMPQTLRPEWRKALGENFAEIHEKYLHTLGNLTMTGYNSKYSNNPFTEKRDMEKGFKESGLWLNKYVSEQEEWTEKEIKERAGLLAKRALKIWQRPETNYSPSEEYNIPRNIDEDFNFTGTKPIEFIFLEERKKVGSWKELYLGVIKMINELDSLYFSRLLEREGFGTFIGREDNQFRRPEEIGDGLFAETNLSVESIISKLQTFLEDNKLEDDDLELTVSEDDNAAAED